MLNPACYCIAAVRQALLHTIDDDKNITCPMLRGNASHTMQDIITHTHTDKQNKTRNYIACRKPRA